MTLVPEPEDAYADVRKTLAEVRRSGQPFKPGPYRALAKTLFVEYLLVVVRDTKKSKSKPKLWKKWYFWVAAAVVVVVVGVVASFAIKDSVIEDKVILKITRP